MYLSLSKCENFCETRKKRDRYGKKSERKNGEKEREKKQ